MSQNPGTLDAQGDLATESKQDEIIANQTDKTQMTQITNGVDELVINEEGEASVVQHSHVDSGVIYFDKDISVTQDFILIDLSDVVNYPHSYTGYIHTENMSINVDATTDADYVVKLGYLENVDATNGDFVEIFRFSGTKKAGNTQSFFYNAYPNGPRLDGSNVLSSTKNIDDTAFQTDVNLASTLNPNTLNTPSGNGDMVMRVTMTTGSINFSTLISYHSHSNG